MNKEKIIQREGAFQRSCGLCYVCHKPLYQGQMQFAHRIGQTQVNYKKYGTFFIDSRFNGEYTCSLDCNASVDIGKSKGKVLDTLADILIKEIKDLYKDD